MEEDCSANLPVAGPITKIAGIDWLQGFKNDTTLRFANLKIQVCSGPPCSIKQM